MCTVSLKVLEEVRLPTGNDQYIQEVQRKRCTGSSIEGFPTHMVTVVESCGEVDVQLDLSSFSKTV